MKSSKVLWIITSVLSFSCEVHQCLGFSISPSSSYGVHLKLEDHATNQRRPIRPFLLGDCRYSTATLCAASSATMPTSVIASTNHWGNIAVLSFAASLAQLLGKTSLVGRLLGAPVTAMALTFVLSSLDIIPSSNSNWLTLLPSGGSQASAFLQTTSLTLATPLLLLGTSIRGKSLQRCGSLLGSFVVASLGTLVGAILAITVPSALQMIPSIRYAPLPNGEGIKIASALLAKNIGGGINYMAVCSCLGVAPESIAAGLCVDNVMALAYFPLTSVLASNLEDVNDDDANDDSNEQEDTIDDDSTSPIESLSHAFTIAAGLTAFGQLANSKLQLLRLGSESLNLSLPITTLLAVLFSTYYPPNWFMSPTKSSQSKSCNGNKNSIAQAGERVSKYDAANDITIRTAHLTLAFCIFLAWNVPSFSLLCNSRRTRLET